jgi:Holliday junction resolvasome RuvABC endonuclease subunit
MKYFLGIDQSFRSSGIVIIDESTAIIEATTIVAPKDLDIFARALFIAEAISNQFIKVHNPTLIGLEGLAFSKIGNATRDLAGLQFTIVNYLRSNHTCTEENLIVVSPNELKKFATTKGNAKKEVMVDFLPESVLELFQEKNYKKTTGLYDVTDAYWIARYLLEVHRRNQT